MADQKLVGQNYTPPDLVAKVTGRAKYAEDYRADGMLFTQAAAQPDAARARARASTRRAALAMPGVKAILTADDLPDLQGRRARADQRAAVSGRADSRGRRGRRSDRRRGDRAHRSSTSSRCRSSSIRSRACGRAAPNARLDGNVWFTPAPAAPPPARAAAAAAEDPDAEMDRRRISPNAPEGGLPMGEAPDEWSYGDLDAGFKSAAVVVDETFVVQSTGHQPMETRSAMAYWQNGKLYLHGSTQSVARTLDPLASWLGIDASNIVLISEYCGGGFGSKGAGAISMAIPALLSKKAGAPVMMRISREEEHYIGRARTGMVGRAKRRLREGRPHHRARSLHRRRQRTRTGRWATHRSAAQRRVADLAAARDALARRSRC